MSCFGNREILIKIEELPIVNGEYIDSIYLKAYDKRGIKDYTVRPQDASYYYELHPYFHSLDIKKYPIIRTKVLPKELAAIFDNIQEYERTYSDTNEKYKVSIKPTSMWYRTSDSGHGGFIDESINISGANDSGNKNCISFTRNSKCDFDMKPDHPIAKLMLNTLNINVQVELMPEHEYFYYPCTTLRRVDNWNYPDPVCDGWRWLHGMPYVSLDGGKSMRVLNEKIKAHVFLLKVESNEVQEGEEYVQIQFPNDYKKEPEKFCNIRSWADFHKEDPNGMIHYRVDKIRKDKTDNEMVADCTIIGQQLKKYSKETHSLDSFYRIVRIVNTVDLNN